MRKLLVNLFMSCSLLLSGLCSAYAEQSGNIISLAAGNVFQLELGGNCPDAATLSRAVLWIGGYPSKLRPQYCQVAADGQSQVGFLMPAELDNEQTGIEREIWLGSPWQDMGRRFLRHFSFRLEIPGTAMAPVSGTFKLQVLQPWRVIVGSIFIAMLGWAMLLLGRRSSMLRDRQSAVVQQACFSLARVQMAWWFFVVLAAYCWLWIAAEDMPAISAQAMGLLGLGSATGLTASGVDASKNPDYGNSHGFWYDILSDADGLVLYRFQLVVFNLLFGSLFLLSTARHLIMPDLDPNVLGLLGISCATYAGFKIPENSSRPAAANQAAVTDQPAAPDKPAA